jgi:hypothetical protein
MNMTLRPNPVKLVWNKFNQFLIAFFVIYYFSGALKRSGLQVSMSIFTPKFKRMGLYHPLDGATNLKYKLSYFLTPNKKKFKEKGTSF